MHSSRAAVALLALATLAGCAQAPPPPQPGSVVETFDGLAPGGLPAGWTVHQGSWGAVANGTDALHPLVLRAAGEADPGLSSLVAPVEVGDFEASVAFKMMSGQHPQGAGMVFHFQDERNHQIIRYSTTENGWHLFTVIDGNRQKQRAASVEGETHPGQDEWVLLRVESRDGHVKAFDGATKVIDFHLPDASSRGGGVGPFVRGDTVALFDDFAVGAA